ncbi:MAG TPA: hypothetical protein PKM73_08480 [Verrucomicrobiota bacterium]|nr:hypothetical protein [Verrucomicrobiota bacterium]HNU51848.1 hypothetical protein [Verrucomicrobiota bacterium]
MDDQAEYDRRFARRVERDSPEWSAFLRPSADHGFLSLDLSRLSNQPGAFLEVRTEELRLSVFLATHHAHFDTGDEEQQFRECIQFVRNLLQERVVTLQVYQGERLVATDACACDEVPRIVEALRRERARSQRTRWQRFTEWFTLSPKPATRSSEAAEIDGPGGAAFCLPPGRDQGTPAAPCRVVISSWHGKFNEEILLD